MSVRSYFHETLGLGGITSSSTPNGLKLNEVSDSDSDGESHTIMVVNDEPNLIGAYPLQGEAPPPPRTLPTDAVIAHNHQGLHQLASPLIPRIHYGLHKIHPAKIFKVNMS